MIGRTISHYRIVETLGSGGMGVVYKAIDTKLGRPVAVKFLNERYSRNHDAVLRFEREARAASTLNDPGICTIYEIEETDEGLFIVMELLEGEGLHARLQRGPLPLAEVLDFGIHIAEALHVAHARGICHRDIKPANIFLVGSRRAKILDFGLAKIEEAAEAHAETQAAPPASEAGTVTGTAGYMSPEQALGKPVDARSDLFSLGLVLYEMATGLRAFSGATGAIYDAIINRNPRAPSSVVRSLPAAFDTVIAKAVQKDKDLRYQTAADLRADLLRLKRGLERDIGETARPAFHTKWMAAAAAVVVLICVIGVGYLIFGRSPTTSTRPFLAAARFTQLTDAPGLEASASLAPDGSAVAFASRRAGQWDIYVQPIDGSAVNVTSSSAADDISPAYSPDGRLIAFRSERDGGGIFILDLASGSVRRLSNFCHDPAWSPDQRSIVCATEHIDVSTTRLGISPLWILDVETGAKRQLTTFDGVQPSWSPNGHRIAYWSYTPSSGIWTIPASGGTPVAVTQDNARDFNPVWAPDGDHLFFASSRGGATNLWRVAVDEQTGSLLGSVEPVTTPSSNAGWISLTRDGTRMAYVDQSFSRNFSKTRFDLAADPPTALTRGAHIYRQLDLSPDGSRIAFASDSRIFVMNADGSNTRQLTEKATSRGPRWSPDGTRLAFYSTLSGTNQIWAIQLDGSGLEQLTDFKDTKGVYYPVWSPDGMRITCTSLEGLTLTVDLTVPLSQRKADVLPPLPTAGASFVAWLWSRDGASLAGWKALPDGKTAGITVFERKSKSYKDLTALGIYPTWLRNGHDVLFARPDGLQVVDMRSAEIRDVMAPPDFAQDYVLSQDERWLYYAEDQREGNVWLITLSTSTAQR